MTKFLNVFLNDVSLYLNNYAFYLVLHENECYGVTYSSLTKVTLNLSQEIQNLCSPFNRYIGICAKSNKHCLEPLILAIWNCGCAVASVNYENPNHFLKLCSLAFVIADHDLPCAFYEKIFELNFLNSTWFLYKSKGVTQFEIVPVEWEMCYAVCTSGSTGEPKLVQVPWSCILPNVLELSDKYAINEKDVVYSCAPYTFDPFFLDLLCVLKSKATLFFRHTSHNQASSTSFRQKDIVFDSIAVDKVRVSILLTTPSLFRLFEKGGEFNGGVFSDLRLLVLGGEEFPQMTYKPASKVYNIYGITEISCWAFIEEIQDVQQRDVSLGKPLNGVVYRFNENGELEIGSGSRKCLVGDEKIAELQNQCVLYRNTGDIVQHDPITGHIKFLTRKDGIIKRFGTKISSDKIKKHFQKHGAVEDCVVVFDRSSQMLGVFILDSNKTSNSPEPLDIIGDGIMSNCISTLIDLEKPNTVIKVKEYPLTSHGKINTNALRKILKRVIVAEKPKSIRDVFGQLWCNAVGLSTPMEHKTFPECGGNSALAVQLLACMDSMEINYPPNLLTLLLSTSGTYVDCCNLVAEHFEQASLETAKSLGFRQNDDYTCVLKWGFNMKKCIDASPNVLSLDRCWYAVVGSHSSEYSMVRLEDGVALWTVLLGDRIESGTTASSDSEQLFVGCYDHYLYCVAARTGNIIWKFRSGGMIKSTPSLSEDGLRVYVGSYDKSIYCLTTKDGELMRSFPCEGSILASPLQCSGKGIFVGTLSGCCWFLQADLCTSVWRKKLASPVFSTPCLSFDGKGVIVAEVEGRVHCLNCATGQQVWVFMSHGNIFSGLRMLPGKPLLIFGCHDKCVYLLRTENKEEGEDTRLEWAIQLDSPIAATPLFITKYDIVVSISSSGVLYLLDLQGKKWAKLDCSGEIFSSPCLGNNNSVVFGCRNDSLLCVDIWKREEVHC